MEEEKKVRKHTTSYKVRNKWNAEHYDRVNITVPKGWSDVLKDYCYERGTTPNAVLCSVIKFEIEQALAEPKTEG